MIKRFLIILFSTVILCGCSHKRGQEEIVFSSWGSITEVGITQKIISEFEKNNPNIKVKFLHIPQNYFQKIHILFASNTEPDVIFINNLYLPVYESRLEDLSFWENQNDFYPQALSGMSYGEKLLAIPRDISTQLFYVNTDILKLPDENWSIKDLLNLAQSTTNKEHWCLSAEEDIYWALPYLKYFGGGLLDNDGNLIIENPESLEGLTFYKNLIYKYNVAPTKSQIGSLTTAQMFLDKKIAMYFSGRWLWPKISEKADFNWAVINFPYGKSPMPCDSSGWAISKNSKHKTSAIKFVKYISSKEVSEYYTSTGLIVPARIDTSQKLNNNLHNEKVFIDVIKHSEATPVNKKYKKTTDEINLKYFN